MSALIWVSVLFITAYVMSILPAAVDIFKDAWRDLETAEDRVKAEREFSDLSWVWRRFWAWRKTW